MRTKNTMLEDAVEYIKRMPVEKQLEAVEMLREMAEQPEEKWTNEAIDNYDRELEEANAEIEGGAFTKHDIVMANTKKILEEIHANSMEQKG